MADSRAFPLQKKELPSIPWAMIAPHEKQAQANHGGQTLERLAGRGGLSATEAVCILNDRRYDGPWFLLPRDRMYRDDCEAAAVDELNHWVELWRNPRVL